MMQLAGVVMPYEKTLVVRGRSFHLSNDAKGVRYSGRFSDHVTGYVILEPSMRWLASMVEFNPFRKQNLFTPGIGSEQTPQEALVLIFDKADEIEARYANVTDQRNDGVSPSRYDGLTAEEAQVEAAYDKLVQKDRLRRLAKMFVGLGIILGIAWVLLR